MSTLEHVAGEHGQSRSTARPATAPRTGLSLLIGVVVSSIAAFACYLASGLLFAQTAVSDTATPLFAVASLLLLLTPLAFLFGHSQARRLTFVAICVGFLLSVFGCQLRFGAAIREGRAPEGVVLIAVLSVAAFACLMLVGFIDDRPADAD